MRKRHSRLGLDLAIESNYGPFRVWVNGSLDTVHSKRKPLVKATAKMRLPTKTPKAGPYLFSEPDQHSSAIPLPSPPTF